VITGLSFDYAGARSAARLAWRPPERLWQQLHTARGLPALLEAARSAPVGAYVSGVADHATLDDIDLAFRTQLRARIAEAAQWVPAGWRAALLWTQWLPDLPAIAHLWRDGPAADWMRADAALGAVAAADGTARRDALLAGPLAPIARALAQSEQPLDAAAALRRLRRRAAPMLPPALAGWLAHWRTLWPDAPAGERAALERLVALARAHRTHFAHAHVQDAAAERAAFDARVTHVLRTHPAEPVALLAYLLLVALDLERLRGECVTRLRLRTRPTGAAP
jgi:hypothetical protein